MTMKLKEITDKNDWNNWLLAQQPNTFLQSWEWGQVEAHDGARPRYMGVFDGGDQVGAALFVTIKAKRGTFLLCPHGPILQDHVQVRRALESVVSTMKEIAIREHAVALRIAPLHVSSSDNKGTFRQLGFTDAPLHIHSELTWILDISHTEDEILNGMRKTTRHAIQRAEGAGVTVDVSRDSSDVRRFFPLYEATKTRHQFVPFSQSLLQSQVTEFLKQNHLYMVFARYEGNDVAAAIMVHFGDTVFYHHGASRVTPGIPAAQLLHWKSIQEAKQRGATTYNFWGIAPDNNPHHPFAGITTFKKGFGGKSINYIHLQDLKLSYRYYFLWAVETLRKYRRGF